MVIYNNRPIAAEEQIVEMYDGTQTLTLTGRIESELHTIPQESRIICDQNAWIVKAVEELDGNLTVTAELDLDNWRQRVWTAFKTTELLLSEVISEIIPAGWNVENVDLVSIRRTIEMEDVTDYDILLQAEDTYNCVFAFDCMRKSVTVKKPSTVEWNGVYIADQLNLRRNDYKGDTTDFCTRLYPYGVRDEETGEALNIKSVNDGVEYVQNTNYAGKIVSKIWRDERYTDAQSLKDAAIEKLAQLAAPVESYECDVIDLAEINPEYSTLKINLYDKILLMDSIRKTRRIFEVVQKTRYPAAEEKNIIMLSSKSVTLSAQIKQTIAGEIGEGVRRQNEKINELSRDVDTNTARIAETYTIGETDALLESQAMQSKSEILAQVSETYATGEQVDELTETDRQIREQLASLSVTVDGVSAQTQHRGGANLLKGTAAYGLDNWEADEGVSLSRGGAYASDVRQNSAAGGGFVLPSGTRIAQTVTTIPDGQYCWMLRYKLTGSGAQAGAVTVGVTETPLSPTSEWTQVRGNLTASGTAMDFAVECTAGTLLIADMILMPGLEVSNWQQAQNEIMTDGMTFANGVLSIGADGEKLSTRIDNASFAVKNNAANKYEAFFDENGSEFGKTTVRGSLTVDPEARAKGLVTTPDGTGHVMFTVND